MPDHVKSSRSPLACIYDGEPLDLHMLPCDVAGSWEFRGVRYIIMRVWEPLLDAKGERLRRARYLLQHPDGDWLGPVPTPAGEYELRQVAGDLDALRRAHGRV